MVLKLVPRNVNSSEQNLYTWALKFLIYNGRPSITPMKDKCKVIRQLDPPKTGRDCRKFCGMVNILKQLSSKIYKRF